MLRYPQHSILERDMKQTIGITARFAKTPFLGTMYLTQGLEPVKHR